ncbi:outer membrane beta-barrel protein [Niabella pedocola]|uniref:Outer membrane beta-barrel protein n=1 Tax=Niabella pedocola TaxID=1752077 RepID=A0ABS8PWI8_9BACT|nr:outer membrane beta-barrel family protein [Niabella pedocola]MCD2425428.1 outer membrane beta-barrel protein [Niabella pedocola]
MRIYWSILLLLLTAGTGWGQSTVKGILAGNMIDSTSGKALAGATIALTRMGETSIYRSFASDEKGAFEITAVDFGYYSIQFSSIGYTTIQLDSIHIRADRYDFNLGDIKMFLQTGEMQTVIVYSEKPLVENKDGTIIYNVGESALSASSSTAEILKTMPLISADADGKLLLKGREPRILIDGKPTNLTAEQLNDLLEAMPGGMVEKIELMTNPPAEYATDNGGVINIVTKKGKVGLTGRLNFFYGTLGDANLSANISYRDKKWILQATGGVGATRLKGDNRSTRENFYKDSSNFLNTESYFINKSIRPNLRISSDYEFNKQSLWNVTAVFNMNTIDNVNETNYKNINASGALYKLSTRTNTVTGETVNPVLTTNYRWVSKKNAKENLNLFASLAAGCYTNERVFFQQFKTPDGGLTGKDSTQRQTNQNDNTAWSLRANYNKPMSKKILWSSGFTVSDNHFRNRLTTDILQQENFSAVDSLSPHFRYFENIYTLRTGVTVDLPALWRIITTAQLENTRFRFDFLSGGENRSNDYWNFLPGVTIRKEWRGSGYNTSLVYRQHIRRPVLSQLNPSVDYSNPYNISFGNPALVPQLGHDIDWNAGLFRSRYYINLSAGYNYVKDIIQRIRTLVPGDKTQLTYENITDRQEYTSSFFGGYTISRKLRLNLGAGYTYNQYSAYDREVNKYKNGASYYASLNGNFIFTDRITFETNIRYHSLADAQGRARSSLKQLFAVQTRWFKKRLTLGITAIDPFRQQEFTTFTYGKNFTLENNAFTQTRNFRISVSYNLIKSNAVSAAQKQKAIQGAVKQVRSKKK